MNDFDPNTQVAIIWSIEDVHSLRANLTDEEAMNVLHHVKRKHDAEHGVSWDTIAFWIDHLYPVRSE